MHLFRRLGDPSTVMHTGRIVCPVAATLDPGAHP
jgi:hypothetical protein